MKTLILFRHAKSSWNYPLKDIDRPLKLKGINRAIKVSEENKNLFSQTNIIFTSPANRALHTAIILASEIDLGYDKISIDKSLYTFSSRLVEIAMRSTSDKYDYVIFVGHNPAFTELINKITNKKIDNLPTASWAKIVFNENKWSEVSENKVIFSKNLHNFYDEL
jgi:phosphohistidine phosphatase